MALIVSTKKYRMSFGSRRTVLATGIVGAARMASVATERGELLLEETSPTIIPVVCDTHVATHALTVPRTLRCATG